jgi:calcineurin-like phosphoesterase family protein
MVAQDDLVYHLGDVIFYRGRELAGILSALPGTKVLVRGNHDLRRSSQWYLDRGFAAVCEGSVLVQYNTKSERKYALLSHIPTVFGEILNPDIDNIHAHFHNNPLYRCLPETVAELTTHHYVYSPSDVDFKPVLLERAIIDGLVKPTLKQIDDVLEETIS